LQLDILFVSLDAVAKINNLCFFVNNTLGLLENDIPKLLLLPILDSAILFTTGDALVELANLLILTINDSSALGDFLLQRVSSETWSPPASSSCDCAIVAGSLIYLFLRSTLPAIHPEFSEELDEYKISL
jgi:hypothetical protein